METDYRVVLKAKFDERIRVNARYSLRAFARDLNIAPSRLSGVLSGTQGLSIESAEKLTRTLGFSDSETELFCQMVIASDARKKKDRLLARERLLLYDKYKDQFKALSEDIFNIISAWQHFAILELTKLSNFRSDSKWMAKRLNISCYEVDRAIERLVAHNLLETKNGSLVATNINITTTCDVPSDAIKNFNQQIFEKAKKAFVEQSPDERDFSTLTLAISKKDIPQLKKMIKTFRRSFNSEVEIKNSRSKDEIYSLSIQFFRLTQKDQS